jgi:hypothetical protein
MSTTEKPKRGRRKKAEIELERANIKLEIKEPKVPQKRGRKPKGGKIITKTEMENIETLADNNIILHLKCCLSDIKEQTQDLNVDSLIYNPDVPPEIESYNQNQNFSYYEESKDTVKEDVAYKGDQIAQNYVCSKCNNTNDEEEVNMKDIQGKIKSLKLNLYKDELNDKKSACFWCTYDYDNLPFYIPKNNDEGKIYGYGSFCRPECAVAYLMNENIDDSTKFERYNILNSIYSKIYDYKQNIKPAPNPYYTLDKFYGNLTIQEYRRLLNSEHLLLVIEKPMTRVLPELFEDNDKLSANIYGNNSGNVYKVKKQSEKKPEVKKSTLIQDTFNIS